jgi:short-subunit dehydrogenase
VVGLSATLFHELSAMGSNVKVSVLCPGAVATEFSDADRNWPAGFGAGPPPSQELGAQHVHDAVRSLLRAGLQPAQVAELVVDAVRDERFMILTEPGLGSQVLASLSSCIDGHSPLSPQALRTGRSA